MSPGKSHAPNAMPLMVLWPVEMVNVSLIANPKLMVQASVSPLMGPFSYSVPAEAGVAEIAKDAAASRIHSAKRLLTLGAPVYCGGAGSYTKPLGLYTEG